MKIDYLWGGSNKVHAINCHIDGASMHVGILCLITCQKETIRIANETYAFTIEIPAEYRSKEDRVKVFNAVLNILDHEQV